ncbi:serine/threonine protein kinase [Rivularia sp. UHCC 0363]|uniref:serine/threonine protein kinase n=1 Tax=Rivularia sp. UHCC 0363 TaxID=3110244 RepID=UPI002B21CF49|nr:serine/threonine protein kinase [Rivularia sp. UHCC 0363]MEA5594218.1 serine/threonine protein kinase [Rivularia sp. UHCC 0363]
MNLQINRLTENIHVELLPKLQIESVNPHDPIKVCHIPYPWMLVGTGNYAAVVHHPDFPDLVVKIYAPGRPGFEEEVEVYKRLGKHPAFSELFYAEDGFLVLKRLYGVTIWDCIQLGIRVPKRVIQDIDRALDYARNCGLFPHDVHARNVMMYEGRGLVVDISDFLQQEYCSKWDSLKKAYYWIYLPLIYPLKLRVPLSLLNFVRKGYRFISSSINRLMGNYK